MYLARELKTGANVAIKMSPVSDIENLKNEIALQRLTEHPCIVTYHETYQSAEHLWVRPFAFGGLPFAPRGYVTMGHVVLFNRHSCCWPALGRGVNDSLADTLVVPMRSHCLSHLAKGTRAHCQPLPPIATHGQSVCDTHTLLDPRPHACKWRTCGDAWQIVLEFVHGGTLTEVLGPTIPFPEACIAYCCRELVRGLAFMHRNHKLHRDIKSDNILVGFNGDVKIADFGFAASLTLEVSPAAQLASPALHASVPNCRACARVCACVCVCSHPRSKISARAWWVRRTGWRRSSFEATTTTPRWTCGLWASLPLKWPMENRPTSTSHR